MIEENNPKLYTYIYLQKKQSKSKCLVIYKMCEDKKIQYVTLKIFVFTKVI